MKYLSCSLTPADGLCCYCCFPLPFGHQVANKTPTKPSKNKHTHKNENAQWNFQKQKPKTYSGQMREYSPEILFAAFSDSPFIFLLYKQIVLCVQCCILVRDQMKRILRWFSLLQFLEMKKRFVRLSVQKANS